jgi:membrane fusion protein, heavy metal efflux system
MMMRTIGSLSGNGIPFLIGWSLFVVSGCLPSSGDRSGRAEASQAEVVQEAAPEISDLDRPLELLLSAHCEHGILQYTCDECRYEVGAVKVDPVLFEEGGPLDTLRVGRRSLSPGLELDGEVALDAGKAVALSPHSPGIVRNILVDLGDHVRARQVLCELDCPEFSEAKAQYLRARAARRLARTTWERESELYQRQICPQKDLAEAQAALEEAEASERSAVERLWGFGLSDQDLVPLEDSAADTHMGRLPLRAPFAGTVLDRNLNLGATVEPGERLLLLGQTSQMWILTDLRERDLAQVIAGQARGEVRAEVRVTGQPGCIFEGRLDRLGGTLDPATRTVKARILVDNSRGLLRAGMFARVRLQLDPDTPLPAVPEAAVLEDEGRSFVFVAVRPPYIFRRPVQAGSSADGWTGITAGLEGGETVITRGAFLLKSDVLRSKMGAGCAD